MHTLFSFIVSILIALHVVASPAAPAPRVATTTPDMPVLIETPDITIYAPVINGKQTQPEDWQCSGDMCTSKQTIQIEVPAQAPTPKPPAPTSFTTPSGAVIGADGTVLFAPHTVPSDPQPEPVAQPQTQPVPATYTPPVDNGIVPASTAPTEQECKTIYAHRTGSVAWYRCQALYSNQ